MDADESNHTSVGWRPGQDVWLESRNYFMRTLKPEDAVCMKVWWADPEIMVPLRRNARNYTLGSLKRYINKFDNVGGFLFGIFVKHNNLHIGWRRVYYDAEKGTALNDLAIGDKTYQSRGVNFELQNAVYDFMFYSVGIKSMVAYVYADNGRSCRRTERAGYRSHGILPEQHFGTDGVWHDVIYYEMSERDWRRSRKWFYSPTWQADYWSGGYTA